MNNNKEIIVQKTLIEDQLKEIEQFNAALKIAEENILSLKEKMSTELNEDELSIYDAHISIVNDPELIEKTVLLIQTEAVSAEFAFHTVAQEFIKMLAEVDDDYIKSRVKDIEEVTNNVISIIKGESSFSAILEKPVILVSDRITTNQLSTLKKEFILGIITAGGGATDHTAIISKALGIPLITGIQHEIDLIQHSTTIIIDGIQGYVHVEPDMNILNEYEDQLKKELLKKSIALADAKQIAKTKSGKAIKIYANIGNADEAKIAELNGADGIGLLRTELCFLERKYLPSEEEHYTTYKEILDELHGKEVVIRLLDIGSDKKVSYIEMPEEENPAMGLRALRLGFSQYEKLLKPQLRAIIKLSAHYNIKILCPMIATLDDLHQIKKAIKNEIQILSTEGINVKNDIELGIMVEIPNVALMPELFAEEVDFFSFGTNDLAQYMMAADRTNTTVSNYLAEAVPGIMKMIEHVTIVAHEKNKWVGICGELASQHDLIEKFIKIGVDELSMSPSSIPQIKSLVRGLQ